jgi:CheY-like chemotaxis protein
MLLQRPSQEAGFRVQSAEDGAERFETFPAWQSHLIWMDMSLPLIRGRDAVARIGAPDCGAPVTLYRHEEILTAWPGRSASVTKRLRGRPRPT